MNSPKDIVAAIVAKAEARAAELGIKDEGVSSFLVGYLKCELESALAAAPKYAKRRSQPLDLKPCTDR